MTNASNTWWITNWPKANWQQVLLKGNDHLGRGYKWGRASLYLLRTIALNQRCECRTVDALENQNILQATDKLEDSSNGNRMKPVQNAGKCWKHLCRALLLGVCWQQQQRRSKTKWLSQLWDDNITMAQSPNLQVLSWDVPQNIFP